MPENHQEEAAKLGFDLTKQFITLAVGGIAFVVGLSYSAPTAISSFLLWGTIGVFGCSALLGLFFLMHGVNTLSEKKSYDIYATSFRLLAASQIVLVLLGVALLCPILYGRPATKDTAESKQIQIKLQDQMLSYPVEADKNYTIELENGNVKFSATK